MRIISEKRYQIMNQQNYQQMRRLFEQKDEIERLRNVNFNLMERVSDNIIMFKKALTKMSSVFNFRLGKQSEELIKCFEEQK